MDELESQIARLGSPEPSVSLDARIEGLLNRKPSLAARRWRAASLLVTATCAGAIGFLLGRQSAPHGAEATALALPQARGEGAPTPPLEIVVSEDELADFFIVQLARENVLGGGSPRVGASLSPNQSRSLP